MWGSGNPSPVFFGSAKFMTFDYANNSVWVSYGGLTFVRVCPKCGKFVKADPEITVNEELPADQGCNAKENATCKRCGRVRMPCEGWV